MHTTDIIWKIFIQGKRSRRELGPEGAMRAETQRQEREVPRQRMGRDTETVRAREVRARTSR